MQLHITRHLKSLFLIWLLEECKKRIKTFKYEALDFGLTRINKLQFICVKQLLGFGQENISICGHKSQALYSFKFTILDSHARIIQKNKHIISVHKLFDFKKLSSR